MSDRVEDWEDDGHVCQECVNKDAEIERLKAVVDAARNVSVARPGTMAEALNEMIDALAALEDDDE